jgi:transcriptional regulator with GAF, ATPase, and Fis domain
MSSPSGTTASPARTIVLALVVGGAVLQVCFWLLVSFGFLGANLLAPGLILIAWAVILALGAVSSRRFSALRETIDTRVSEHRATLDQVEQLEAHNEMLQALAQSTDVTLAFQVLARRVARIVPCDRVGLALLKEGGQEFQTYTARVTEPERRTRPRLDLAFNLERTHIGHVVRTCQPLIVHDFGAQAADFLDANVLHQTGFQSGLVLPLISKNKAVGTLNVVSRVKGAFNEEHRAALAPIAEILAVAYVAQQLQQAVARYRTMEAMAELTLSIASEIQSALQTIIGHCILLERGYPDATLQRDVAVISKQSQRIQDLLERMRSAAQDRLREVAEQVQGGIPAAAEPVSEAATGYTWRSGTPDSPVR